MALTLWQGAQLAKSLGFRDRIEQAMIRAARDVAAESQGTLTPTAWKVRNQLATRIITNPSAYLDAFVKAVTSDAGSSLTWWAPVNIASSTNANPIVVTTAVAHGLAVNDFIEITNHAVNTNANGAWQVNTAPTSTTFSIAYHGNGVGTASGAVQKQETDITINFVINSAVATNIFSAMAGLTHEDRGQ